MIIQGLYSSVFSFKRVVLVHYFLVYCSCVLSNVYFFLIHNSLKTCQITRQFFLNP